MRLGLTALALACAAAALCGQARADEIYTLSGTYAGSAQPSIPAATLPFVASLDLTDAQVETGGFSLNINPSHDLFSGDLDGFTSIRIGSDLITPSSIVGALTVAASFDAAGNLGATNISWAGVLTDATLTGTGASTTVTYLDDDPAICPAGYGAGGKCNITAAWTRTSASPTAPVPEPASLALFGAGLIGLAVRRVSYRAKEGSSIA